MYNSKAQFLARGAAVAALYVGLTMLSTAVGLSSGVIQLRLGEILMVLPAFMPAAIPGLFIGCILANVLSGCLMLDVLFGSIATLIGAVGAWLIRRAPRVLLPLPAILANTAIVPFILYFVYRADGSLPFFFLTVFLGELLSAGVGGYLLATALRKYPQLTKYM